MRAAERREVHTVDEKGANKLEAYADTESLETYAKAGPAKEIASLMKKRSEGELGGYKFRAGEAWPGDRAGR